MSNLKRQAQYMIEKYFIKDEEWEDVYLGEGSTRVCLIMPDPTYVVKISIDTITKKLREVRGLKVMSEGIQQCLKEVEVWKNCPDTYRYVLNPVEEFGIYGGHMYIVQKRLDMMDNMDFYEICDAINEPCEDDLEVDIKRVCYKFNLCLDDALASSNVGVNEAGLIKVADYGFLNYDSN